MLKNRTISLAVECRYTQNCIFCWFVFLFLSFFKKICRFIHYRPSLTYETSPKVQALSVEPDTSRREWVSGSCSLEQHFSSLGNRSYTVCTCINNYPNRCRCHMVELIAVLDWCPNKIDIVTDQLQTGSERSCAPRPLTNYSYQSDLKRDL